MVQAQLVAFDPEPPAASWRENASSVAEHPSAVWGDGFAGDRWCQIAAVTNWSQCSVDEYVRLFPRLLADGPKLGADIIDHLSWRSTVCPDAGGRAMLRALLSLLKEGIVPDIAPMSSAAFAFHAGLHPAYLWPAALCTAERDTAAGWLGLVSGGRAALMPPEVADYLLDTIVGDGPTIGMRDPAVASLVDRRSLDGLRARARRRRAGADPVGRLRRGTTLTWLVFGSSPRSR